MNLSHKIEILPNKKQQVIINKACGTARFAYNYALKQYELIYNQHKENNNNPKPNINEIKKEFNRIKEEQFPWIYDSPKDANQQPFANLKVAFNRFFKGQSKYPKLKKKKHNESFYVSNDRITINEKELTLPIIGKVKMREKLRFNGKIANATISKIANKFYININVELDENYKRDRTNDNKIGLDLGIIDFVVDNNGKKVKAPKPLKRYNKILKRTQRRLSKKKKGSNNRHKAKMKLNKLHFRISNIRNDFLHKLSTNICRENQTINIENLKVSNMIKNHKLAKAISDLSWHEFRRQLEYKCKLYENKLNIIDTFYPSSKLCSNCGNKKTDLSLADREYNCDICGICIDRDINAAINIFNCI
jgi:putative transposase